MNRNNMLRHFKLKHQFQFVNRLTEKKKRAHSVTSKKSSPWSKYCTEVGENQFQCIICSNVLNMPKAHGNLKRHIKFKHPSIYEKETKESLKCFWKQFGISSGVETPKITKNNEEVLEVEEAVLGEAEYLEEYVEEEIITDETAPIIPDTDKEKNPMEEAEPEQQDSKVDTDLLSKSESVHTEIEIPIVHEITYQDVDKIEDFGKFKYLDEDDEKFEEKIKWLANTAEPEKSSLRSRLWNFFNEIRKNLYECKLCRRKLAGFTSSSSNLKRHLALVHARAYEIIANSPHFKKIPKGTIERLEKCINKPAEKSFEASYFENQGDSKHKCKVCDKVIHSEVADSVLLFKHINEEHSEEVVGGIEEPVGDEKEISVLFVKKKDLQIS